MTARNHRSIFLRLALVTLAGCCATVATAAGPDRHDDQVAACVDYMAREVGKVLAPAPDFHTLHEATAWVARHLPPEIRERLTRAGAAVSTQAANDAFTDIASLKKAILGNTLVQLAALPGCPFDQPDSAVPREALLDQFTIALDLEKKSVIERLRELHAADAHHAKHVVFYGVVLDLGGIAWTDEQLVTLVRHLGKLRPADG